MIQNIKTDQVKLIHDLAHKIWPHTFRDILSQEQITYMLDWMYNLPTLMTQIQSGHEFYIYYEQDQAVGFMGVEKIEHKLKIHKLYVLPEKQGQGIGKIFFDFAIARATELDCRALFLNVNRFNSAAQFYKRMNMQIIKEEDIEIGNGYLMEDYVFEISLI
jgi:diamine N-acetyltransferase